MSKFSSTWRVLGELFELGVELFEFGVEHFVGGVELLEALSGLAGLCSPGTRSMADEHAQENNEFSDRNAHRQQDAGQRIAEANGIASAAQLSPEASQSLKRLGSLVPQK